MCNFFSCCATRKAKIFFCEEDSHETIIERMPTKEDIVRIEVSEGIFKLDMLTIPEWYERQARIIERDVMGIYNQILLFHQEYEKVCSTAHQEYEKVRNTAQEEYKVSIKTIHGFLKEII